MPLGSPAWGDQVTDYGTTRLYALMELREVNDPTYGHQVWRYLLLDTGAIGSAGLGVMKKDGTTLGQCILSGAATAKDRMLGVAQQAIPASNYFWALCEGTGLIQAGAAAIGANVNCKTAAAGQFTDGVIGTDELVAFAEAAQAVQGSTTTAIIDML